MKRMAKSAVVCLFVLLFASTAFAALNQFAGKWKNVNPNTRGITMLDIVVHGKNVTVQAWGKCHPKDCDWGRVKAVAYAPSVSSDLVRSAQVLSAVFRTSFSRVLLVIHARGNQLRVHALTHFTDGSNRTDYSAVYNFRRTRVAKLLKEDCISFNPRTAKVAKIRGHWKVVDGSHWLFDFGNKKAEAVETLRIIKFYGMNQSCFVGRPYPSFKYMLISGRPPVGRFAGEDCIAFNPDTVEVKKINGHWKIVDGSQWMFDFGNKKAEAEKAFRIIKKYRFRYSCFVGRPHASFQYMRK